MNLILLDPTELEDGGSRARLCGRRHRHVARIQRARVGDELRVGVLGGRVGTGRITSLDDTSVELEIALVSEPPPPLPLALILALPRPPVLRRVLQSTTAMGVKRLTLLGARRVEGSYWQSRSLEPAALRDQMLLGLEQARDTQLPELVIRRYFRPFVEDELPALAQRTTALVAHPEATASCPRQVAGPVTLVVGPEGGFVPFEIERLESCGFQTVGLGERVLRVETAVPALLARIF